jgi:hypothetical protein
VQFHNTLQDLLVWSLGSESDAKTVRGEVPEMDEYPEDTHPLLGSKTEGPTFSRLDQAVADGHAAAAYHTAVALGRRLSSTSRLGKVVGGCATDSDTGNDQSCLASFIQKFGARALRRPLDSGEVTFYARFAREPGSPVSPTNVANVIAGLLSSPRFTYHVETATAPAAGAKTARLDAFELAARLSYHFWDAPPDEGLWQAASDGSLLRPETFSAQVDRLLDSPRAQPAMKTFFAEWLRLDEVPALDQNKNSPRFKAFAADHVPTSGLRQAMVDELTDLAAYLTWTGKGTVDDLLTTELAVTRNRELARVYGLPSPWDGNGAPPRFTAGERPGVLTRAAVLASASGRTRPIMRGVFVRGAVLCDDIPDPPPGALDEMPKVAPTLSSRQEVEAISEVPGSPCAGCHQTFINPLGFMLERYDALGRVRTREVVFDDNGRSLATHDIDDRGVPQVVLGDTRPGRGAPDLARMVVESKKVPACLARRYFRFTMGRKEDPQQDGCMLERLRQAFGGKTLRDGLKAAALDAAFWQRSL